MGASISWSCAKADNKPDLKTRIFKTERLTSIARLSLRAATGHIQPPSTTAKTPIDSVARFIMYSSQGRSLSCHLSDAGGEVFICPRWIPPTPPWTQKSRNSVRVLSSGVRAVTSALPAILMYPLRLCFGYSFAADARDTRPSWVRVASKQAGARIMSDPVSEKVLAILASVKRIPRDKISIDTPLQALGIDSLDTIVLLSELEKAFRIAISDDDARSVRSVRDVVEEVRKLAGNVSVDSTAPAA
ncbi:MAG: hypothetical protein DMG29_00540 [Acidobacteria bacterium]|nr:MAG: hypothetical protein DMG29_00540 [Acidobacteriota bacterium]